MHILFFGGVLFLSFLKIIIIWKFVNWNIFSTSNWNVSAPVSMAI